MNLHPYYSILNRKYINLIFILGFIVLLSILALKFKTEHEIRLIGKIIDQNKVPIKDVEVFYKAGDFIGKRINSKHAGKWDTTHVGKTKTNEKGIFLIDKQGTYIWDLSFKKPGYYFEEISTKKYLFDLNQATNVGIIYGWLRKDAEVINYSFKEQKIVLDKIGHTYTLKFKDKIQIIEDRSAGDLCIIIDVYTNKKELDRGQFKNWSIFISPIKGGIIECDNIFYSHAPQSGYNKYWEKVNIYAQKNYHKNMINKAFFIKARDGELYGKITVSIYPFSYEGPTILLTYIINNYGNRNLLYINK